MFKKKLIESYLTLTIWYLIHQGGQTITTAQFEIVLQEIGNVEDQLIKTGISQRAIEKLIEYSEQIKNSKIEELSENAQLRLCKIIFGDGTHWDKRD